MLRIYIECPTTSKKIFLLHKSHIRTRKDLLDDIGGPQFKIECPACKGWHIHHVNDVVADKGFPHTYAGIVIGAIVGLLGGPIGMIIGAILGWVFGDESERKEEKERRTFNDQTLKKRRRLHTEYVLQ